MNASQLLTLVVGLCAAAASVWWAVVEVRRDARARRFVLMCGPLSLGLFLTAFVPIVALIPVLYGIFSQELVPKGSPGLFAAMLAWVSVTTIASMIALITLRGRREALGWITLLTDDTLRVDAEGSALTLTLRPRSVRIYFLASSPQYALLSLRDGETEVRVWGMLPLRDFHLVTEGHLVAAQGLMVGGSLRPLCAWLTPYVAKD